MGQLAGGAGGLRKANPRKLVCQYEAPVLLILSPRNVQSSDGYAPPPDPKHDSHGPISPLSSILHYGTLTLCTVLALLALKRSDIEREHI
jgi:hypothetical protein